MFPLVEFPELVQHYAPFFQGVFSAEAFVESGISGASNDMSPWSPWCTAYCVPPNTTLTFANRFNVNSR